MNYFPNRVCGPILSMKLKPELQKRLDKIAKEVEKWPKWKRSIDLYASK